MSLISGNLKDILSIKLKQRHDSISDQFNRILMVKMLVIFSIVTSMEFFSDKVSCIMPHEVSLTEEFVHSTCWIRGFYIYKELMTRPKESSYYGIPRDVEINGVDSNEQLCRKYSKVTGELNPFCFPLTKMFYTQYQFFPFYIASLAIAFYLPYLLFRIVNSDMINLKTAIKESENEQDVINIMDMYFNYKTNGGVFILRCKVLGTIVIKFLYLIVSVCTFLLTDKLLDNKYVGYGPNWLKWSQLPNTLAFDFSADRGFPKPGEYLLPSMGFCDIVEGVSHMTKTTFNEHRIICEISTHIIYQYVLFVLWFLFVTSITLSSLGLLHYTLRSVYHALCRNTCTCLTQGKKIFYRFTVRETEYIELIRVKKLSLYVDLISKFEKPPPPKYDK